MSRNLPTSAIQRLCGPEWVAKTYSEYMLDCANAQFNLVSEVAAAVADDQLEEIVDAANDIYIDFKTDLVLTLNDYTLDKIGTTPYTSLDDDKAIPSLQFILDNEPEGSTYRDAILASLEELATYPTTDQQMMIDIHHVDDGTMSLAEFIEKYPVNDWIKTRSNYTSRLNTLITQISNNLGIAPGSQIVLDDGTATLSDVIKAAVSDSSSLGYHSISLNNIDGSSITSNFTITADDLFDQLKSTASSAIAWGIGFASMSLETMSDKLSYFEAQVKAFISDATESFASSVNVVRSRIASAKDDILNFFEYAAEELGWNDIKNDNLDRPSETDVYAYTGASPLGAIDTSSLKGVATAVAKTALAIGAGIFEGAKALLKKAWKKIKPYVKAVTDNPVDIGVCDTSDNSYTCTTWLYHAEGRQCIIENNEDYEYSNPQGGYSEHRLENIINSKLGHWISIDTFFCEMQIKFNSVNSNYDGGGYTLITYDYRLKPKCINYRAMIKRELVALRRPLWTPAYNDACVVGLWDIDPDNDGSIRAWENFATSGELYPENDEDEAYVYMGFVMSLMLTVEMFKVTLDQIYQWNSTSGHPSGAWRPINVAYQDESGQNVEFFPYHVDHMNYYTRTMIADTEDYWVPKNVSNLDFLKICSGYRSAGASNTFHTFNRNSSYIQDDPGNTYVQTMNVAAVAMLATFLMQQVDRHYNPSEYLYLPYYNNSYELSNGRYKIKTDAENADVANVIVNAVILIAVVLTIVVLAKTVLKIRKRAKQARLTQRVGELDDKMWKGNKLTFKERNRYFRAKNKLAKMEGASSGLAGSGSVASKIYKAVGSVQSLMVEQSMDGIETTSTNNDVLNQTYAAITGKSDH